jgi:hypothetical protein
VKINHIHPIFNPTREVKLVMNSPRFWGKAYFQILMEKGMILRSQSLSIQFIKRSYPGLTIKPKFPLHAATIPVITVFRNCGAAQRGSESS